MVEILGLALPMLLFIVGVGLTAAEAFIPGAHFFVIGVALLGAGLVGLLVPFLAGPLALAAMTLIFGVAVLYVYRQMGIYEGGGSARTKDSASLKGEIGTVTERVTTDGGEVKLDDGGFNPYYRARAMQGSIEEGERVMVVDPGGGNVVTVEPLGAVEGDIDRELARDRERTERERDRERAAEADREPEDA